MTKGLIIASCYSNKNHNTQSLHGVKTGSMTLISWFTNNTSISARPIHSDQPVDNSQPVHSDQPVKQLRL